MIVYIDGDACPVKEIVKEEAEKKDNKVVMVTSFSHFSDKNDDYHIVYVDEGPDSADYKIVELITKGDVLITQDYGLASLVLGKGAYVMHHSGQEYTSENIGNLLETRHVSAMLRKSGQKTKGPKKIRVEDKEYFRKAFCKLLNRV